MHFEEHQWKDSNRKHLKSSAIPIISLQFRQKDYIKNVCFVLLSTFQDEGLPSKFLHVLNHTLCTEKETEEETQKLLKDLGIQLIKFGLQKARIQRKKKLLYINAEKNRMYKSELKYLYSLINQNI